MPTDSRFSCPNRRGKAVCQTEGLSSICIHCNENILGRYDGVITVKIMEDVFSEEIDTHILVQSVNCMGAMNAGLAKAIRHKYPEVYEHYSTEHMLGLLKLGYTSYIPVDGGSAIISNICGQERYGKDKRHTNYSALRTGLSDVKMMAHSLNMNVIIPYKLGCGLGGGDWYGVVLPMIEEIFIGDLIISTFQGGDEIG